MLYKKKTMSLLDPSASGSFAIVHRLHHLLHSSGGQARVGRQTVPVLHGRDQRLAVLKDFISLYSSKPEDLECLFDFLFHFDFVAEYVLSIKAPDAYSPSVNFEAETCLSHKALLEIASSSISVEDLYLVTCTVFNVPSAHGTARNGTNLHYGVQQRTDYYTSHHELINVYASQRPTFPSSAGKANTTKISNEAVDSSTSSADYILHQCVSQLPFFSSKNMLHMLRLVSGTSLILLEDVHRLGRALVHHVHYSLRHFNPSAAQGRNDTINENTKKVVRDIVQTTVSVMLTQALLPVDAPGKDYESSPTPTSLIGLDILRRCTPTDFHALLQDLVAAVQRVVYRYLLESYGSLSAETQPGGALRPQTTVFLDKKGEGSKGGSEDSSQTFQPIELVEACFGKTVSATDGKIASEEQNDHEMLQQGFPLFLHRLVNGAAAAATDLDDGTYDTSSLLTRKKSIVHIAISDGDDDEMTGLKKTKSQLHVLLSTDQSMNTGNDISGTPLNTNGEDCEGELSLLRRLLTADRLVRGDSPLRGAEDVAAEHSHTTALARAHHQLIFETPPQSDSDEDGEVQDQLLLARAPTMSYACNTAIRGAGAGNIGAYKRIRENGDSSEAASPEDDFFPAPRGRVLAIQKASEMTKQVSGQTKSADQAESSANDGVASKAAAVANAGKVLPPCKYWDECTRKNPQHFKEYAHSPTHPFLKGETVRETAELNKVNAKTGIPTVRASYSIAALKASCTATAADNESAAATVKMPANRAVGPEAVATATDTTEFRPGDEWMPRLSDDEKRSREIGGIKPLTYLPLQVHISNDILGSGGSYKVKYVGGQTYSCNCPVWRYQMESTDTRTCKHLKAWLGEAFEAKRCGHELDASTKVTGATAPMRVAPRTASPRAARGASPSPGRSIKRDIPGVLLAQKGEWPPPPGKETSWKGWWMSEKLDGVRAYWDGQYLCSRNGNTFNAPDWFTASLPKDGTTLDGELFMGRKNFQSAVSVVKGQATNPLWGKLRYVIFDVPSLGKEPFEQRMEKLKSMPCLAGTDTGAKSSIVLPSEWFDGDNAPGAQKTYARIVPQVLCNSRENLEGEFDAIAKLGGEGIMMRQAKSLYVHKRSTTLMKLKSFEDTEGIIIAHEKGTGRIAGALGAYLCELRDKKQFKCGTGMDDAHRRKPLPVGTIITVRYQELTNAGVPRFPVFVGPRYDIDWP